MALEFQFPPNGKAYPKHTSCIGTGSWMGLFQFPPNGKAYPKRRNMAFYETHGTRFQFPPNGKAYPKASAKRHQEQQRRIGFNSLRTGKHIQSRKKYSSSSRELCFNSLRTGKHIQSISQSSPRRCIPHQVSIPSERESISKDFYLL